MLVIAALVGGLVGALILILAYFVGVALVGAALGALVVTMIWGRVGRRSARADRDRSSRSSARWRRCCCSAT